MLPGSERKAIIFRGHVSAFVREQTQIQTLEALVANLRRLWFWQRSKSPDIAAIRNLAVQIRVRNHGQAYAEREAKRTVLLAILPSFIGQPLFRMWASAAKHRSLKFPHHRKEKV